MEDICRCKMLTQYNVSERFPLFYCVLALALRMVLEKEGPEYQIMYATVDDLKSTSIYVVQYDHYQMTMVPPVWCYRYF